MGRLFLIPNISALISSRNNGARKFHKIQYAPIARLWRIG